MKKYIKDTKELFKLLKISKKSLSLKQKNSIKDKGFLVIPPTKFMLNNLKELNKESNKLIKKDINIYICLRNDCLSIK